MPSRTGIDLAIDPQHPAPRVDTHAHVLLRDIPRGRGTATHAISEDYPAERYIAELDRCGITYGMIAASSQVGLYNDYQIRMVRRHKRLRTTVIVDPATDLYTFEKMDADGVVGVRFAFNTLDFPDLESIEYRRFLHRIRDHDWHVQLHADAERFPMIAGALAHAGVKLVIDHFGRPDISKGVSAPGFAAILHAVGEGRTWVKLSAPYRLNGDPKPFVDALLAAGGAERLLWGSDWPFTGGFEHRYSMDQALADFERLVPDPALRRVIGNDAPMALYGLPHTDEPI